MKILFVCTGNTCRSAVAERMFRKMLGDSGMEGIEVSSCGIAGSEDFRVPDVISRRMEEMGVDMKGHISRPVSGREITDADLILVMDKGHLGRILGQFSGAVDKTFLLKEYVGEKKRPEILDPIGQADEIYISCISEIKDCLEKLLQKIRRG